MPQRSAHKLQIALPSGPLVDTDPVGTSISPSVLAPAEVNDIVPRSHGQIRKLRLAPPAGAVGASTTFTASTDNALGNRTVEIPSVDIAPLQVSPPASRPFVPSTVATSNGMGPESAEPTDSSVTTSSNSDATLSAADSAQTDTPESDGN